MRAWVTSAQQQWYWSEASPTIRTFHPHPFWQQQTECLTGSIFVCVPLTENVVFNYEWNFLSCFSFHSSSHPNCCFNLKLVLWNGFFFRIVLRDFCMLFFRIVLRDFCRLFFRRDWETSAGSSSGLYWETSAGASSGETERLSGMIWERVSESGREGGWLRGLETGRE